MILIDSIQPIVASFARASVESAALIAIVFTLRTALGGQLTPRVRTTLWAIVGLRLAMALVPVSGLQSRWSLGYGMDRAVTWATSSREAASAVVDPAVNPGSTDLRWMIDATGPTLRDRNPDPVPPSHAGVVRPAKAMVVASFAIGCWAIGAATLAFARWRSWRQMRRAVAAMDAFDDDRVSRRAAEVARMVGVRRDVRLVATDHFRSPAVFGTRRPTIILPRLMRTLGDEPLRLMLLHEFTHIRHCDLLVDNLAEALRVLHWFNPFVWLAIRGLREDRELACDAAVLRRADGDVRDVYGSTLLQVLQQVRMRPVPAATIGATGRSFKRLHRRIELIARFDRSRRRFAARVLSGVALVGVGFVAVTCAPSGSSRSSPVGGDRGALESPQTCSIDIRDLLIDIPQFVDASPTTSTSALAPASDRAQRVTQLIDLISTRVDPASWKSRGGSIGEMREANGQLIVTQTTANQARIATFIQTYRQRRALQVLVTARFVSIDPAKLPGDLQALISASAATQPTSLAAATMVPRELSDWLSDASKTRHDVSTLTAPRLTLFDGQHAYVEVTTKQAYITSFTKTPDGSGEHGLMPTTDTVESGITFEVQAVVSADRRSVTLTLHPTLTRLMALTTEPFVGDDGAAVKGLTVQRPSVDTLSLQTTVSVPDGATVLLHAPMAAATSKVAPTTRPLHPFLRDDDDASPHELLILVTPTVVTKLSTTDESTTRP